MIAERETGWECSQCGKISYVLFEFSTGWTQCDDYYDCGGCCSAGRELLRDDLYGDGGDDDEDFYLCRPCTVYELGEEDVREWEQDHNGSVLYLTAAAITPARADDDE